MSISEDMIKSVIAKTAGQLIEAYSTPLGTKKTKLIFPLYRSDDEEDKDREQEEGKERVRVSEQEGRFLFALNWADQNDFSMPFSIETPTPKKHCFSGFKIFDLNKKAPDGFNIIPIGENQVKIEKKNSEERPVQKYETKGRKEQPQYEVWKKYQDEEYREKEKNYLSGQFDLCIHDFNSIKDKKKPWDSVEWVVEFKGGSCGGPSGIEEIYKDFEKMYLGGRQSVFFHVRKVKKIKNDLDIFESYVVPIIKQYREAFYVMMKKLNLEKSEGIGRKDREPVVENCESGITWLFCIAVLCENENNYTAYFRKMAPKDNEAFPVTKEKWEILKKVRSDHEKDKWEYIFDSAVCAKSVGGD